MPRRTHGEGSVYMRKDGRAAASAIYEGKRITKYGKTKTEAKQKLDAFLADLRSGKAAIGPKQTVEEYLTRWLKDSHRLKVEPRTFYDHCCTVRAHILTEFGHLQLTQLTKERIQAFYAKKVDAGYSPATIKAIHARLSSALKDAVADGLLARNPCTNVTLPKQKRHRPHVLNKEQAARLVAAARGRRLWFLILVGLATGARLGELVALRWSDIDLNNLRIHIRRSVSYVRGVGLVEKEPKTASGVRKVMLTQVVIDAIPEQKEYIASIMGRSSRWTDMDLVFPNTCGLYMHQGRIGKELRVILQEAGISAKTTFHDLRHSFATILFAAGVNPKVVQEALGHSKVSTTLGMYGDVLPDMQDQVGGVLESFLNGGDE